MTTFGVIRMLTEQETFELMVESGICTMDFGRFHEMAEKLMGYPIWTHEFALPGMRLEMEICLLTGHKSKREASPFETLLELVPKEKIVVVLAQPNVVTPVSGNAGSDKGGCQ